MCCAGLREGERYRKEERDAGEWGVVMMMVRDDEMWLNEKLFARRGGKERQRRALSMMI